jgi:hypothetical protein
VNRFIGRELQGNSLSGTEKARFIPSPASAGESYSQNGIGQIRHFLKPKRSRVQPVLAANLVKRFKSTA